MRGEKEDDLISRQAAIDAAIEAADDWDGGFSKERERFIRDALEELPSAQPNRMRGRWTPHREKSCEYIGATLVYVTYDYWFCDACGYRVEDGQPLYNFCPNCGADMRCIEDE